MNNLAIQPTFRSNSIKPKSSPKKLVKQTPPPKTNSFEQGIESFWKYVDKYVIRKINNLKNKPFSLEPFCSELEMSLKKEGVNIRFDNNRALAELIKGGFDKLKEKNIPLPKNFFFFCPLVSVFGIFGITYFLKDNAKESPIILPFNMIEQENIIKRAYKRKDFSSPNPLHNFYHEVGHWLHLQKDSNIKKYFKLWENMDIKQVEKEISKNAILREDGVEFYAEMFAKEMHENS